MTITQEMVSVLFEKETIEKVKNQFINNQEIVSVDSKDMNFRLLKAKEGNINLELLATDSNGMYFKVIGYYEDFEKVTGKLDVTIMNEFEEDFEELESSENLDTENLNIRLMDIEESGLIAAFSRETVQQVQVMYKEKAIGVSEEVKKRLGPFPHLHAMQFDKYLTVNGLQIELLFSMDGFPQFFLDDEYNVQGAFGAYFKDENGLSLNPSVQHKHNFDKFYRMGLFSAFKSL